MRFLGGVTGMSKMSALVFRSAGGGVDAPCMVFCLDGAPLEPLIALKIFTESMVELRSFRFLRGAIPARSKALVRGPRERVSDSGGGGVRLRRSSSGELPPARSVIPP